MSNKLIEIITKVFNAIQIRAFGRLVINKCNVIRPEEIYSVPNCMACGIIMLKKWYWHYFDTIGYVPRKNFISVALGIHTPFDNDEISLKAMCNARPDQDRTLNPKTISFNYATVGITFISPTVCSNPAITSMNGKPRLLREKNAIQLLSKPALACMRPINTIYAVTSLQNTTSISTTCT